MDEASTKEELRPVKKQLVSTLFSVLSISHSCPNSQKQLKLSGEDMPRDDKVAILKDSLAAIGRRIEHVLAQKQAAGEDTERWRRHLWTYVARFHLSMIFFLLTSVFQIRDTFLAKEGQGHKA